MMRIVIVFLMVIGSCTSQADPPSPLPSGDDGPPTATTTTIPRPPTPAELLNGRLRRSVNLAGQLELGRTAQPLRAAPSVEDIVEIAAVGFTAVRIPIDFASWASGEAPYEIDPEIFDRVAPILATAQEQGMAAIIDLHHYEAVNEDPAGERDRLQALWIQIATHYRDEPLDSVAFEVLNEPYGELTTEIWNELMAETIGTIRAIDPTRVLIVGPGDYNDVAEFENFEIPPDENLIVTFHYYAPFEFTHQGADWIDGYNRFVGLGFDPEVQGDRIRADFATAIEWAGQRRVPLLLGEFGVIHSAAQEDRVEWTTTVRETAEDAGISWAYWDWGARNFGLHDETTDEWDSEMLAALMPGS